MYNVLEELYVCFSKSCKRGSILQDRLQTVENALKLRNLSKTRWVYRSESIDAMWRSFEAVKEALALVGEMERDQSAKAKASGLQKKILKFDFIFAIMFMRVIMKMTKILTVQMQRPELNILDALSLIDATVKSLERIRNSESEMNSQVQASVQFAKSFGLDPEQEFAQKRTTRTSSRIDENPHTTADIQFYAQYRKSMIEVLDSLITEYKDNTKNCLEKIKLLAQVLQPPIAVPTFQQVEAVIQLFPPSIIVDPERLAAEFEVFSNILSSEKESCESVRDACEFAYRKRLIFPAIYSCFKLLFTAPVTVAKNERSFSKMNNLEFPEIDYVW